MSPVEKRGMAALLLLALMGTSMSAQGSPVWEGPAPDLSTIKELERSLSDRSGESRRELSRRRTEEGFRAYRDGRLVESARLFRCAVEADAENALARYKYAAVLSILAASIPGIGHTWAEWEAGEYSGSFYAEKVLPYQDEIFTHLLCSVVLDDDLRSRLAEDADFDAVRRLPRYTALILGPEPGGYDVIDAFPPTWFCIQQGAFMPYDELTFLPDRRIRFAFDMKRRQAAFPDTDWVDTSFTGIYRVDGDRLVIFPDGRDDVILGRIRLELSEHGFLLRRAISLPQGEFGSFEEHVVEAMDA